MADKNFVVKNGIESFGDITFTPNSTLVGKANTATLVSSSASPVVAVPANRSIEFSDTFYSHIMGSINVYRIRFNDADQFWSSFSAEVQGLFSGLPNIDPTWPAPTTPVSLLFKWRHVSVDQYTNLDANTTWITNRYTRFDNIVLGESQSFPPSFWFNLYSRSNTYTGGPIDDRVEVVAGTLGYSLGQTIYTYNGQSATNNASSSRVYIDEVSLVYGSTVQVLVTSNQNIGNEFSGKTVFGIGANYLDVSDFTFNGASATYSQVSPSLSAGDNIYSFDESKKSLIKKYFDGSVSASVEFDPIVGSFNYNGNEVVTDAVIKVDNVDYQTIAIGASAMYLGLAGVAPDESIAIGYQALQGANGAAAYRNIAIGYRVMPGTEYPTDIYNNTIIGWNSGRYVGTVNGGANHNTGVGYYNLRSLTTGNYNTGIGAESLSGLSTGSYNTAVGANPGGGSASTGSYNTAVGVGAGKYFYSGSYNTAIGFNTMSEGYYGGSQNVAIGSYAGQYGGGRAASISIGHKASSYWQNASTASYSISIGFYAAERIAVADNISIGKNAARYNASGGQTVCIGPDAMSSASGTGTGNCTAIGFRALYVVTGNDNTAVGSRAGESITSGTQNTIIGYDAAHANGSGTRLTTGSNNTVIGYQALPSSSTVSNTITLGNSSIATLRCQVTSITALSDQRDKTNIATSQYGLELVNQLRPVTFDWNTRDGAKVGIKDIGFIAQELVEVEDALNAHDTLALTYRDNPEKLEASYGRLIPVLVKAIQELSAEVEILKNR